MDLESLLYAPFGNNIIIGKHIREQLKFLRKILPENFRGKSTYDLGCGDGKITILLQKIFNSKEMYGCDINKGLVKRGIGRKIRAKVLNLEKAMPCGELAIMWGVLHHLKAKKEILKRIKDNFQFLVLREPLQTGRKKSLFELGDPFLKCEIEELCQTVLDKYQSYEHKEAYFVLWQK